MRALITGVDGFVGGHLARHLLSDRGIEVFGTTLLPVENYPMLAKLGVKLSRANLVDPDVVDKLLQQVRPDRIFHLAAQSSVRTSFENPWATLENNIRGQLNILHTVAQNRLATRILVIGSGEEYGPVSPDEQPINEGQPLRPTSPYSVSKVAQDMLGFQYFVSHEVATVRARPFNHTGPGQGQQFVAPAFASQIAAIERNQQEPIIKVGNLDAQRDITDVRDVVRAYTLLLEHGEPGEVYNIGSDSAVSVRSILDTLLGYSAVSIEVQVDPSRFRPGDTPIIVCDSTKLRAVTGWRPTYSLETTLSDILDDWRSRLDATQR